MERPTSIDEYIYSFIKRKAFNEVQINYGSMDNLDERHRNIKRIQFSILRLDSFNLFKSSEIKLRLKTNLMLTYIYRVCYMLHELNNGYCEQDSIEINTN